MAVNANNIDIIDMTDSLGRELEVEASNFACKIYADEFRGKVTEPYKGSLIYDLLVTRKTIIEKKLDFPDWMDVPQLLGIVWAMATASGAIKCKYKKFEEDVLGGSANMYECAGAFNVVAGELAERTFFRLPKRLGNPQKSDEAATA